MIRIPQPEECPPKTTISKEELPAQSAGAEKADQRRIENNLLYPEDHHLGRLDQRCNLLPLLQSHFADGIGGDYGCDVLTTDR